MTPDEQLATFSGSTDDLAMSGLWYSHARVTQLVEAARQECRDRECTEADVRARLTDAEQALARVRELADQWDPPVSATLLQEGYQWDEDMSAMADDLRAALDGKP